nr:RNA-directed DNA polymerase, eukaryota [Tanacetum cinerariifolium]
MKLIDLEGVLEGVFYTSWWSIWSYRNHLLFSDSNPRKDGVDTKGTTAPEVPPPKDVSATAAPEVGQSEGAVVAEPHVARESRKRGHDGIDASAPPKLLRRDHADRPSDSSHEGKSLAAMQLCMASNVFVSEGAPADVSDPDPLSFADAPSHHPVNVAQMRAQFSELQVSNERLSQQIDALQQQVSREETLKAAFEDYKRQQDQMVEQRFAEMDACLDALSIDFDEELYPHMLTAIAGRSSPSRYIQRCATPETLRHARKRLDWRMLLQRTSVVLNRKREAA